MEEDEYRRMAAVEESHWWYASTRALLQDLLGPALVPGGRFLDAGAGTGATGAWLERDGQLVASDFEPGALALYGELHPGAQRVAADVTALPFADGSFDAALCVTVLCHRSIPDPAVAVAELARVVRPGGVVCLLEPGRAAAPPSARPGDPHRSPVLARRPPGTRPGGRSRGRAGHRCVLVPGAAGHGEGGDRTGPHVQRPRRPARRAGRGARRAPLGRNER